MLHDFTCIFLKNKSPKTSRFHVEKNHFLSSTFLINYASKSNVVGNNKKYTCLKAGFIAFQCRL